MVDYNDSSYKFTNPIRYFKANDPIYYEVENIPLKQLQENDLWLKDQITTTVSRVNSIKDEFDRSGFSELKPYCDGTNNVVKVKPGRFTARINDAYNLTPLQIIKTLTGGSAASGDYNSWSVDSLNSADLSSIISKFRNDNLTQTALNMNGLVERAFSYPAWISDRSSGYQLSSSPVISNVATPDSTKQPPYPLIQAQLWNSFNQGGTTSYVIRQYDKDAANIGFASLGSAESEFIKKWRGVARTSVVDIPDELSITIPEFNTNDFYYYNEQNQRIILNNASQRIDLLFVYSKPVDSSGATVAKFDNLGKPTTITKAELGLVRGAGIGLDFFNYPQELKKLLSARVSNSDGTLKILPHVGDQNGSNNGFKVSGSFIKGSFPSPDDLMNLTPLLDEELANNHYALIGQSILPIAYIVVRRDAQFNNNAVRIITTSNIIDIRPFFRTTELSYNERAGIAAAVPAPSLANPVVTQAELDYEIKRTYANIVSEIRSGGSGLLKSQILATGIIQGGFYYGVEGSIARRLRYSTSKTAEQVKTEVRNLFKYTRDIPDLPEWDLANWCANITGPGLLPNDRINRITLANYNNLLFGTLARNPNMSLFTSPTDITSWEDTATFNLFGGKSGKTPPPNTAGGPALNVQNPITIHYIKKKIKLSGLSDAGFSSYNVNVQYLNCCPITGKSYRANTSTTNNTGGVLTADNFLQNTVQGIWVEKSKNELGSNEDYFTIYVAIAANDNEYLAFNNVNGAAKYDMSILANRKSDSFVGFSVINSKMPISGDADNINNTGLAVYPTIQFEVVGIPNNFPGTNMSFGGIEPIISVLG
jgi:hypothetical protein